MFRQDAGMTFCRERKRSFSGKGFELVIIPRFLFVIFVCMPCLFIDDVVRMDSLCKGRLDTIAVRNVCCQILEEKKDLNLIQHLAGDIEASFAATAGVRSFHELEPVWQSCLACETDQSFSRIPIRIQQFTSRCQPEANSRFIARCHDTFCPIALENVFSLPADVFPLWLLFRHLKLETATCVSVSRISSLPGHGVSPCGVIL